MKILLINTVNLEANGISTFIINVAKQLVKKNFDVTILAPNEVESDLMKKLKNNGVHLKEINGRSSNLINYFIKLRKYLSYEKFDVVHVNGNSTTMAIELLAAKLAGVKLRIAHSHNTTTEHLLVNKLLRPIFEYSVNGRLACNDAAGQWLFKRKKFTVIRNGIDLDKYKYSLEQRKKIREKLGIKSNQKLLGHVGYFNYQKNQIFLVHVLKRLPNDYKLIFIGEGDDLGNIKAEVDKYNLKDRIIFTGNVTNVSDYLSAMDLFLLPSRFEGQPFVLIESSASGLKNIVSDRVSVETDLCENNIYVDLTNIDAWVNAIKEVTVLDRYECSLKYSSILKNRGYDNYKNVCKVLNFYRKML